MKKDDTKWVEYAEQLADEYIEMNFKGFDTKQIVFFTKMMHTRAKRAHLISK